MGLIRAAPRLRKLGGKQERAFGVELQLKPKFHWCNFILSCIQRMIVNGYIVVHRRVVQCN